jgi:hypothetical protein
LWRTIIFFEVNVSSNTNVKLLDCFECRLHNP